VTAAAPIAMACLLATYLVGSIPSGLLIARWFGGVDIRTVGSGNIGATNVGRVLGFRFFVVVFLLDYLKGFLPTLYLPPLAARASGQGLPDLPVGVAVAAIVGHNFPVYLKFKGGKGVATSLGAVSALDPLASVAAASGFGAVLLLTGYVSMSSILGGLAWIATHFARVEHPWSREQIAMSVATIGLMGLLIARHRKNLARIVEGTEPRVRLRKPKGGDRPPGKAATILVVVLALAGGAGALAVNARRVAEVDAGPYRITEVDRVATGHQRAERLTFADRGRLLAATCPRYGRAMLYRVTGALKLDLVRDIPLGGRPVALGATADRVYVLVRPNNDARHVEEGWMQALDLEGRPAGPKVPAGFYPDDLALSPDGRLAMVLTSGRGEGGPHRPMPALTVFDLAAAPGPPRVLSRVDLGATGDDPARLALRADGALAAVSFPGSHAVDWVDLADPAHPRALPRRRWPRSASPDALRFDGKHGLLAADEAGEALWHQAGPDSDPVARPVEGGSGDVVAIPGPTEFWAYSLPFDSGVAFLAAGAGADRTPDRLPLLGRANLSSTRPLGLAAAPERGLLAVANRSGGSIHLVAIRRARP